MTPPPPTLKQSLSLAAALHTEIAISKRVLINWDREGLYYIYGLSIDVFSLDLYTCRFIVGYYTFTKLLNKEFPNS